MTTPFPSSSLVGTLPATSPFARASDLLDAALTAARALEKELDVRLLDIADTFKAIEADEGVTAVKARAKQRGRRGRRSASGRRASRSVDDPEPPPTGAATFTAVSANRKLAPVEQSSGGKRPRPRPVGPFVSTTSVSIAATCGDSCPFKSGGCYVTSGFTRFQAAHLDKAAEGLTAQQVIAEEVKLIDAAFGGGRFPQDGARGGRDLRLHVGGDVGSVVGARLLAGAAQRLRERGGGAVWTFTHAWREIPREAWGSAISVLASVERPEDIEIARAAGYAAAITVEQFPADRAFRLPGTTARIIPCPAESRGRTCVECRLCLDDQRLLAVNAAIALAVHGPGAKRAREQLVQLRLEKNGQPVSRSPSEFSSARGNKRRGAPAPGGPR